MPSSPIAIPVALQDSPYEILIGEALLERAGELAAKVVAPCRSAIITDDQVAPLYGERLLTVLKAAGFDAHLLIVPAGEASKSMEVAAGLCDRLIELGLDRKGAVFALGGGVIGDLAGFVASIHYVAGDEFETKGTRALLNFGHTIGHAIDSVAGYGILSHGECVAIGMIAALDLSARLAGLPHDQADRVKAVITACGLPTTIPADLPTEKINAALGRDKKFDRGAIRFVLTKELGSAFVSDKVTLDDVTGAVERLQLN